MDRSWLSSTIDYVYNTVSGDERDRSGASDYQRVFSNGVWINDLPTSEPLETSCVETQATPQQYKNELKEIEKDMAALKAKCVAKNKEIATLKEKLRELEVVSHKTDRNVDTKPDELQQELKKAKRTAFVANGNLIKKNSELDHLKNELESAKERERQWKENNDSLKSQICELRQELADFRKNVFEEIKRCQLPAGFAGLDSFKEREKQWKESNNFLKSQISDLQQQLAEFKNDVVNQIKRCQQPPCFAHQSSLKEFHREEAKELKEKIERVQEKIAEEEENIYQQKHQLQNLSPPTNAEQAMPKASLPPPPGEIQYSSPPVPSQPVKEMACKANPYSLRAAKAKRGVLNARPLPPSIGVVHTPAGYGQLMNNPVSKVDQLYQPSPIWNPYASSQTACPPPPPCEIQYSTPPVPSQPMKDMACKANPYSLRAARAQRGVLNARPLPPSISVFQTPTGNGQLMNNPYSKVDEVYQPSPIWNPHAVSQTGEESGFFSRTFNKGQWFGF